MNNLTGDNHSESGLFDRLVQPDSPQGETGDPVFARKLWSGTLATFYTLHRDGKIFLMKAANDNGLSRFMLRREYELGRAVDHPNIARLYSFEESLPCVGTPGIIMEWVDGETLDRFLERNSDAKTRRGVMEQILRAAAYMHSRGIVHNDLKPANILVRHGDRSVRLIDFGLSDDDAHRALRTPGCTAAYAAPELLDRHRSDARSDVYSLGLIMKETLGGRYRVLWTRCVDPRPDKRYADARALLSAFHRRRSMPLRLTVAATVVAVVAVLVAVAAIQLRLEGSAAHIEESVGQQSATIGTIAQSHATLSESVDGLSREVVAARDDSRRQLQELEKERLEREAFFADIDNEIERMYSSAADSIAGARFRQFATAIIINYYKAVEALNSRKIAEAAGKPFAADVQQHITRLMEGHRLLPTDVQLPSLSEAGLTDEELEYYGTLLMEGKPYSPMPSK